MGSWPKNGLLDMNKGLNLQHIGRPHSGIGKNKSFFPPPIFLLGLSLCITIGRLPCVCSDVIPKKCGCQLMKSSFLCGSPILDPIFDVGNQRRGKKLNPEGWSCFTNGKGFF